MIALWTLRTAVLVLFSWMCHGFHLTTRAPILRHQVLQAATNALDDEEGVARKNVLGGTLQACCFSPLTGFYRDGFCRTGPDDVGSHTVCVRVDEKFLAFSRQVGNDLSTPYPMYGFPGLQPGDSWCLCALRWKDAFLAGMAPTVVLASTHVSALQVISLQDLLMHASADCTSEDELQ